MHSGAAAAEVRTPLIGEHNVLNCLAAAAAGRHLGLSIDQIVDGLQSIACVPGRLERIDEGQEFAVYVDYAHTDDALRRAVDSVRNVTAGRVFCVFGAGGNRDADKRPLMGRAAASADVVVVTSDNPRNESPGAIIDEILHGADSGGATIHVEPDRSRAIGWALGHAAPGDAVLVAGKGHEQHQIIGTEQVPFDDRIECRAWLNRLAAPAAGGVHKVDGNHRIPVPQSQSASHALLTDQRSGGGD